MVEQSNINVKLALFTDGSCNTKTNVGVGTALLISYDDEANTEVLDVVTLKDKLKVKTFANTSSSQLEVECALWAITETANDLTENVSLTLFTDS